MVRASLNLARRRTRQCVCTLHSFTHLLKMDTYDDDKETGSPPSSTLKRRGRFQLQVPHNPSSFAPSSSWSNKSLDPVKPSERVWSTLDYTVYWWSGTSASCSEKKCVLANADATRRRSRDRDMAARELDGLRRP